MLRTAAPVNLPNRKKTGGLNLKKGKVQEKRKCLQGITVVHNDEVSTT